jgi:signal transduction histidine kinase
MTQATLLRSVQNNLRSISLVICVLVTGLSMVFSKAMTRRISELLRAIRIVREGEYSHRASMGGSDELAQLASEFNRLAERIQTTEEVRHRFVSDASHELKTPLAAIRLLTDSILQSGNMDDETRREFLSDIGEEAERLSRISDRLLMLTRLDSAAEPRPASPVNMKKALESVVHLLTPLAEQKQVVIETALDGNCMVSMTEDAMHQVAFNLIENAIKYNKVGGRVDVELLQSGDEVILRVMDTGIGIPPEERMRVFERFYRVDKARSREAGGTGLGLAIVAETVRQYGGAVSAEAREGGGTCFTASFPAWKEGEDEP